MELNISQIAETTGFDRRTVSKRLAGLEPIKKHANAHYYDSIVSLRKLYMAEIAPDSGPENGAPVDPRIERARLDRLKADHQEMINDKERGKLLDADVIQRIWSTHIVNARNKLMGLSHKIAGLFPEQERPQVFADVDFVVRDVLANLADTPADESDDDGDDNAEY